MPPAKTFTQPAAVASFRFTTAIAAGGSDSKTYKNDTGSWLKIFCINGDVRVSAAGNAAIPAYKDAAPLAASNDRMARAHFRLKIESSSGTPWTIHSQGALFNSLVGTADNPFYLPQPFAIAPGEEVSVTLFNDSGTSALGQVDFVCQRSSGPN
ncbi:MAG: hypothetical protein ACKVW3_11775 [Phycisphaerales bacterium]